jgi:hypothetical protein
VSASTDGHDLDLDHFLSGNHTIYLYAPVSALTEFPTCRGLTIT